MYKQWLALIVTCTLAAATNAAELPENTRKKIEIYRVKLIEWAANPLVVKTVKDANAKGGPLPGMSNAKWDDLPNTDPQVLSLLKSPLSQQLGKWEEDKNINKLFVRDNKGNMVGGSEKTLIFNASARPTVKQALTGQIYIADEVKPDPTTQIKSVQMAVPVLDGGKAIGVLHTAISAE
jgi:hypothetical protein